MDEDERYLAYWLGMRTLRSKLIKLVAFYEGQIFEDEFRNLEWNMTYTAKRPNIQLA